MAEALVGVGKAGFKVVRSSSSGGGFLDQQRVEVVRVLCVVLVLKRLFINHGFVLVIYNDSYDSLLPWL